MMPTYVSTLLLADRQREYRRQADNWRLVRRTRTPRAGRYWSWHIQSPLVRRPVATPCP